jgi:ABC-type lipoprotein export system ATPase subunit
VTHNEGLARQADRVVRIADGILHDHAPGPPAS